MSPEVLRVIVALGAYVVLVLVVGLLATRRAGSSPEEYFLAGRRLGKLVLFMALFGTNATAFVFIGVPGKSYHDGIGMFGLNASIVALCTPLTFYFIGVPARRMALRLGAVTPAELYARRFDSTIVGLLFFLFFTVYTVPYMVSAVVGAAVTLEGMTQGAVPYWAGGAGVVGVALFYTSLGGMRATAWTNVLQGAIFLGFLVVAFVFIVGDLGGPAQAMRGVAAENPDLLRITREGLYDPRQWTSWALLICMTVIAFPHMFVRLMAAENEKAIKTVCRLYPLALIALWLPPVLIGTWGAADFPDLAGRASDQIFQLMVDRHLPAALAAIGFVAVLAAVMSSLDAMILTLSSMLVRDVVDPFRPGARGRGDVLAARLFALAVAALVYILAQVRSQSVFDIASIAFSGYVTLTPTLLLGVRWRRFNARGAIASLLAGNAVLLACQAGRLPTFGFLPVLWGFLAALVVAVGVSLASEPAPETLTDRAFG